MTDNVQLSLPCDLRFIHLVGDALESYLKTKIKPGSLPDSEGALERCRVLMYELFSNAVRHSPSTTVDVTFSFQMHSLVLEVITEGAAFVLRPTGDSGTTYEVPYPDSIVGSEFPVYEDDEEMVQCRVLNNSSLEFTRKRTDSSGGQKVEAPDHFGMLLLASLSDEMRYSRTGDGSNVFALKRNFPKEAML